MRRGHADRGLRCRGQSGGGGFSHAKEAEFEKVKCDVEGGKIEVWGKVEGPADHAKVLLVAEGKADKGEPVDKVTCEVDRHDCDCDSSGGSGHW